MWFRVICIKLHPSSKILLIAKCEEVLFSNDQKGSKEFQRRLGYKKVDCNFMILLETGRVKTMLFVLYRGYWGGIKTVKSRKKYFHKKGILAYLSPIQSLNQQLLLTKQEGVNLYWGLIACYSLFEVQSMD